jgi:hypothetical protein
LAKAVGPLATVVELAAPLLQVGGVLLAHKSARQAEREWAGGGGAPPPRPPPRGGGGGGGGGGAARRPGAPPPPRRIVPLSRSPLPNSVCVVCEKVAPCPETIPRREGLARSRPLGR